MENLKTVLASFLEKAGLTTGINQQQALLQWSRIVGTTIARNTNPEKIEHGILTVRVASPTWRQELLFSKTQIIDKINESLGKQTIKDIRFI
ncbi:MAG: DUF721 domain-containing protein [Candidatus Neomarinimicrobiota bacterium]